MAEPAVPTAPPVAPVVPQAPQAPATQVTPSPAAEVAPARRSFKLPDSYFAKEAAKAASAVETPAGETPAPPAGATPATPEAEAGGTEGEDKTKPEGAQDGTTDGTVKAEPSDADKARRRADRAYRKAAEERVRRELAEQELARVRSAAPPADSTKAAEGAPKLEQFDDIEKYAEAKSKYDIEQHERKQAAESAKKKAEESTKRQAEYVKSVETAWEERALKGAEKYEDWDAVVGEIKPTSALLTAVMKAPNGEDVAHHLGKNAKEFQRIASLPWVEQAFEIGLLSGKLSQPKPAPKQPSKAPAPIAALPGTSDGIDDGTYKKGMSHEQYLKLRPKIFGVRH